jgi:hypothetical protein
MRLEATLVERQVFLHVLHRFVGGDTQAGVKGVTAATRVSEHAAAVGRLQDLDQVLGRLLADLAAQLPPKERAPPAS